MGTATPGRRRPRPAESMQGLTNSNVFVRLSFLSGRGFSAAENPLYLRMTLSDAGFVGMHPIGNRRIRKLRAAQRAKGLAGNLSPRSGRNIRSNVQSERVVYRAHLRCAAGAGVQGVYGSGASEATGGDEGFPGKCCGARPEGLVYTNSFIEEGTRSAHSASLGR